MDLPNDRVLAAIAQRYARITWKLGDEIGSRPMVLPNGEFFPDQVGTSRKGVQRLVDRMRQHAGMEDIPVRVELHGEEPPMGGASCCGGSCSGPTAGLKLAERLVDEGDGYKLALEKGELADPVVLCTQLARTLAGLFLNETLVEGESIDPPVDVTVDLVAVALGFGALMLEGSYIYKKSCGGPSVLRATHLGCAELAPAFALFIAQGGHSSRRALSELGTTQKALVREAQTWVDSNPRLVRLLRDNPKELAAGNITLRQPQPSLLGWLARGKGAANGSDTEFDEEQMLAELEEMAAQTETRKKPRPVRVDPVRDELRALVDEALDTPAGASNPPS